MNFTQEKGKEGEELAVHILLSQQFQILERNWRFGKAEIDIIAKKGEFIVFVEVKTRSSKDFGKPEEFVSNKQQKLIVNAAHEYITSKDLDLEARFDIIAITTTGKKGKEEIEHIEAAFYPTL